MQNRTEADALQETAKLLHRHYERNREKAEPMLAEDLLWIGPYDSEWAESKTQFSGVTADEYRKPPLIVNREQYRVVAQNDELWVVAGSFDLTGTLDSRRISSRRMRLTVVWQQRGDEWQAQHVHVSCAQTTSNAPIQSQTEGDCNFHATDHRLHSIAPEDVLYVGSRHQYCDFHLIDGTKFTVRISLNSACERLEGTLHRVHRSFAVNAARVVECKYCKITLENGEVLPCAADKAQALKDAIRACRMVAGR